MAIAKLIDVNAGLNAQEATEIRELYRIANELPGAAKSRGRDGLGSGKKLMRVGIIGEQNVKREYC